MQSVHVATAGDAAARTLLCTVDSVANPDRSATARSIQQQGQRGKRKVRVRNSSSQPSCSATSSMKIDSRTYLHARCFRNNLKFSSGQILKLVHECCAPETCESEARSTLPVSRHPRISSDRAVSASSHRGLNYHLCLMLARRTHMARACVNAVDKQLAHGLAQQAGFKAQSQCSLMQ
jgi:hypothetical protein